MITYGLTCMLVTMSAGCLLAMASSAQAQSTPVATKALPKRVVHLGDSITDGHTYTLLLDKALRDAGLTPWVGINAGVGGHTAKQSLDRLDRDVLAHQPDLVSLMIGTNDAAQGVPLESYKQSVTAICDRLHKAGVKVMLLTAPPLGEMQAAKRPSVEAYNAFLRDLAQQRSYALAEVFTPMAAALEKGEEPLEGDHIHITFMGYQIIARAMLDALGLAHVKVPDELSPVLMPGLVQEWRLKALPEKTTVDEAMARQADGQGWTTLHLPMQLPADAHWWAKHEAARGFATDLQTLVGDPKAKAFIARAKVDSTSDAHVFLNTGGHVQAIFVNGQQVWRQTIGWTGWHAGKERIAVDLHAGGNIIVIETGSAFFLSLTHDHRW